MGESCNAPFYLILYYINISNYRLTFIFATRIFILTGISINIFGDVLFGSVIFLFGPVFVLRDR